MLVAFNEGYGQRFASFFDHQVVSFEPYSETRPDTNIHIGTRRGIGRYVVSRWLHGDGWTASRLGVPSAGPGSNAFFLTLQLSRHGIVSKELGTKIIMNCDTGLIQHWVGPAQGP